MRSAVSVVSSKEIQRVRRLAKRVSVAIACAHFKLFKVKYNDSRPCKQCSDISSVCVGSIVSGSTNKKSLLSDRISKQEGVDISEKDIKIEILK